jgi:hypothetical protein
VSCVSLTGGVNYPVSVRHDTTGPATTQTAHQSRTDIHRKIAPPRPYGGRTLRRRAAAGFAWRTRFRAVPRASMQRGNGRPPNEMWAAPLPSQQSCCSATAHMWNERVYHPRSKFGVVV